MPTASKKKRDSSVHVKSIPTAKRLKTSIKTDVIHPSDYARFDFRFACEDCSHFTTEEQRCTLGYESKWHRKEFQKTSYELTGKMALCRFLEID